MDLSSLLEVKNGMKVPRNTPERWEELKRFPVQPGDVFIVSFPKSGTTWTQQIVKLLRNGGQPDEVLLDRSIPWLEVLDCELGKKLGYTSDMVTSSDALSPRVFKSHLSYDLVPGGLPHTTPAKYIYVMRNPKDACVSAWHHVRNMGQVVPWEGFIGAMLSEENPFGGWFTHVLGWWEHKDTPNILFVKYEDMKTDPHTVVRSVAQFIGIESVTDQLIHDVVKYSSFSSMKKSTSSNYDWMVGKIFIEKSFIRKGEIGSWREHFSEEQSKRFDEIYSKKMAGIDLNFQFE